MLTEEERARLVEIIQRVTAGRSWEDRLRMAEAWDSCLRRSAGFGRNNRSRCCRPDSTGVTIGNWAGPCRRSHSSRMSCSMKPLKSLKQRRFMSSLARARIDGSIVIFLRVFIDRMPLARHRDECEPARSHSVRRIRHLLREPALPPTSGAAGDIGPHHLVFRGLPCGLVGQSNCHVSMYAHAVRMLSTQRG